MTKITFAIFLGAACASSWWAVARWVSPQNGELLLPAIITTALALSWIGVETYKSFNGE